MNLSYKLLLIIFSIIGISTTFMAWIVYPKSELPLYGYVADGIVTGFIFLVILLLVAFNKNKTTSGKVGQFFIPILSLFLVLVSYEKYADFLYEKANLSIDNPMIALGSAGYYLGPGIFVMGISGVLIFITWFIQYFKLKTDQNQTKSNFSPYLIAVVSLVAFGMVGFYHFKSSSFEPLKVENTFLAKFDRDVKTMGDALKNEDYKAFMDFSHPSVVETFGGKEKYTELIAGSVAEMKHTGTNIIKVNMGEVIDMQKNGQEIQAVITQVVTFNKSGNEVQGSQRLIAISDDEGAKWHYLNINNKPKAEMLKTFPFINQNLNF